MKYIETIFWIASIYDEMHGWPDKETETAYYRELKELLESVQWKVFPPQTGRTYPVAVRGKERLELTPKYLHGIIAQDSSKGIGKILLMAKGFRYQKIEVLTYTAELSGPQYLLKLRSQQEEMKEDILKICEKEMTGIPLTAETIYKKIEKKYHIQRVGEYGEDVILNGVFKNLLSVLVGKQLLEETVENGEPGYRRSSLNNIDAA